MSNNNFRYQTFVAVSGNLGGKVAIVDDVLFSHEQEIYPTASLDENCIEFEFQTDRNYYGDLKQSFLALKLKFVRGRGYDAYESKEKKKEHKAESEDRNRRRRRRRSSSSYLRKQLIAFNLSKCRSVHYQLADFQFQWTLCTKVLHFKQL